MAFCGSCGAQLAEGAAFCPKCGARAGAAATGAATGAAPSQARSQTAVQAQAYLQDALKALKVIVVDPMDGLAEAFSSMDKTRAMAVGLTFAVMFEVCCLISGIVTISRLTPRLPPELRNIPGYEVSGPGFSAYLKILLVGAVVFAAVTGGLALARLASRSSKGGFEGDIFAGGAAVLPFGILALLSMLGLGEIIGIVAAFAFSYFIFMLYAGCTRISGIPSKLAAPAVPLIIVLTVLLVRSLGMSMIGMPGF